MRDAPRPHVQQSEQGLSAQPVSRRSTPTESSTSAGYHALTLESAASALASHDADAGPPRPDAVETAPPAIDSPAQSLAQSNAEGLRTRLPPRGANSALRLSGPDATKSRRTPLAALPSLVTVASSMAIVLGLFFVVIVVLRRGNPNGLQLLPSDALDILGRAPLPGKQQVYLIRCGGKLLLIGVSPGGAETLTEITEPREVERLIAVCQQGRSDSATATFRQVLSELGTEPHSPGFVDRPTAPPRRGLFGGRAGEASHVA